MAGHTLNKYTVWATWLALVLSSFCLSTAQEPNQTPLPPVETPATTPTSQKTHALHDANLIRVGISHGKITELEYPNTTISATGSFTIQGKNSKKILLQGHPNQTVRISKSSKGFVLKAPNHAAKGAFNEVLVVRTKNPFHLLKVNAIRRKGRIPAYRGHFEITPGYSSPKKFTVVNVLPLSSYLKAVVPNELPPSFGYNALKAQAVAARNYAIRPRNKAWPHFDICDSQYCQAYYGAYTEHSLSNKAIEETMGLVALYQGEPVLALYSSSHGGFSENYENAFSDPDTNKFPGTPMPFLTGKRDIGPSSDLTKEAAARKFYTSRNPKSYDVRSSYYRWMKQWKRTTLEHIINKNMATASTDRLTKAFIHPAFGKGSSIGTLKRLKVNKRGVSGKIMSLDIVGSNGTWTLEKEFVIRKVLQHRNRFLPSANAVFNHMTDKNGTIVSVKAFGGGFGHGVGMSQYGASYMSKHGHSFVDILQHYYNHSAIGSLPLKASATHGMKTQFFAPHEHGRIFVKGAAKETIHTRINGNPLTLTLDKNGRANQSLDGALKPKAINSFELLPTQDRATTNAWIELYPSRS